jgi:U32 family peptidase
MEVRVGHVTHFYNHISVAAVELEADVLKLGDLIHIKGKRTDIVQPVDSLELEHHKISEAHRGQSIGIRVTEDVHENDVILKVNTE